MEEKSGFWDTVKTLFYAALIALFVRTVFVEPFSIPSGSMIPSLLVGDYLFVSKMSYGYSRHSLPLSMPLIKGRIFYEGRRTQRFLEHQYGGFVRHCQPSVHQ